jgi:hypothetical protein
LAAIPDIRPVPAIVIVDAACVNVLFRDIVPVLATTIAKAVPGPLPWEGNAFGLEMVIFRVVL